MFYQVTRLNHAKSHQDFADKAMLALTITIAGIGDAVQGNLDTGIVLVSSRPAYVCMQCQCKNKCWLLKLKMQAKESEKCFNFSPLLWKTHMQGQIYVVLLNIHAPTLKGF